MGGGFGQPDVSWTAPLNPVTGNSATIIVYDTTKQRGYGNPERVVVSCYFDQAVTVLYQIQHAGSTTWRTVNGNGSGDAVSASTPTILDYLMLGYNARIEVVTGSTGPTVSEVDIGVASTRTLAM